MTRNTRAAVAAVVWLASALSHASAQAPSPIIGPPPGAVTLVTKDNFEQIVLKSPIPAFVIFNAPGCRPCEDEAPLVAQAARQYAGKIRFVRIDAIADPEITASIGVTAVPTSFVIKFVEKTIFYNEGFLDQPSLGKFIVDGLAQKPDAVAGEKTPSRSDFPEWMNDPEKRRRANQGIPFENDPIFDTPDRKP
jgi:thiol-disulfide isomerase/thioredoxin